MKFKVGDKVKILPSAGKLGVPEHEIGKVVEIRNVHSPNSIMIHDSRGKEYGCWSVNDYDITPAVVVGQQLLLWEDMYI